MNAYVLGVLQAYGELVDKRPIVTQVGTAGLLVTLGDIIAQLIIERKKKYDCYRTSVMAIIGYTFSGPVISFWLSALNIWDLPVGANVVLDQAIFTPLLLAGFLILHSLLNAKGFKAARYRLKYELPDVLKANWIVWVPAQIVNFKLIPFQYRMLFIQSLALFWNCYLSKKANNSTSPDLSEVTSLPATEKETVF